MGNSNFTEVTRIVNLGIEMWDLVLSSLIYC